MKSRGLVYGLLVGLAIAVPSGMGVALSVLGENTSSLVGVAISASLLPPAVNCGMAFAYAAFGFASDNGAVDDDASEFVTSAAYVDMGGISLALTIVNIGAIFISGSIMFRLKDVTPAKHKIAFWQVEGAALKVYRKHNTAATGIDIHDFAEDDVEVLKNVGSNKLLRKELLNLYKQASNFDEDGEHVSTSKSTIRRKSAATTGGTVHEMFADMESQIPMTPPSATLHKRTFSADRSHHRVPSSPSSPVMRHPHHFTPSLSSRSQYQHLPVISPAELQDTRARIRTFGKAFRPPSADN